MEYDLFVVQSKFENGIPVALGGVCQRGYGRACSDSAKGVKSICLTPSCDGLFLDAQIAHIVRTIAIPQWKYAAVSVNVSGPKTPCGGIAGDIWTDWESAEGTLAQLEPGIFGCAFPGKCACIMICNEAEATALFRKIQGFASKLPLTKKIIQQFAEEISHINARVLFCTDGSGGSIGCVLTKDDKGMKVCWV